VGAALLAWTAAPARADRSVAQNEVRAATASSPKKWLFRGDVGWASPVGLAGYTLAYQHVPWFRTEMGIGFGGSGVQLAVQPTFSIDLAGGRHKYLLGAGPSVGLGGSGTPTMYVNVDVVGYEYNGSGGFFFCFAFGITMSVVHYGAEGYEPPTLQLYRPYPQGKVGFGVRF
jgi:hypothetical protein